MWLSAQAGLFNDLLRLCGFGPSTAGLSDDLMTVWLRPRQLPVCAKTLTEGEGQFRFALALVLPLYWFYVGSTLVPLPFWYSVP